MNIALIGGTGGMGKLFTTFLEREGHDTHCFNRELKNFEEEIRKADIIVISVPKNIFPEIITKLSKLPLEGKGIISLSSYMSDEVSLLETLSVEYAFIHFLFGPDITYFSGQNIVVTKSNHVQIQSVITSLKNEGANVREFTSEEHDILMGHVQALSQLSSIVLAKTLSDSSFTYKELQQASSVTFRHNMETIKRIVKQDAELWSAIQFTNAYFPEILEQYCTNITHFKKLITEKDSKSFKDSFDSIQEYFKEEKNTEENVGTKKEFETQEEGKKYGVLGPAGTYSHEAARTYGVQDADIIFYTTISEVLDALSKKEINDAIVPFENSIHGTVLESLDGIFKYKLRIIDELVIDINHVVATNDASTTFDAVTDIYSHPQALAQCAENIQKNFSAAETHPQGSTAAGMQYVASSTKKTDAAIGPKIAAEKYNLNILQDNFADTRTNQTQFVVLSNVTQKSSVLDTTLLALTVKEDRPGLLADITGVFKSNEINLAKIESRPSREKLGTYIFYVKAAIQPSNPLLEKLHKDLGYMGVVATQLSR